MYFIVTLDDVISGFGKLTLFTVLDRTTDRLIKKIITDENKCKLQPIIQP